MKAESKELTDEQKAEYFRRSYTSVDGLWFMMIEEKYGFEEALERDEAVWKVLPKIQARAIKQMMNLDRGLDGLQEAVAVRMALEGFDFDLEASECGFCLTISRCPWQELMRKSGRLHISERVSGVICRAEHSVWASEFDEDDAEKIGFERETRICQGAEKCILRFERSRA
ncbi:MAG: hypothetical protein EHM14_13075 [Methanothrix sp.]|nr:MAG: hypothetical protein EHM14_13075 [Methanothrix sp.]